MKSNKNEPKMTRAQFEALLKKEADEKRAKREARADRKARRLKRAKKAERKARADRKARRLKRAERKIRKIRRDLREAKLKVNKLNGIPVATKPIKAKSKVKKTTPKANKSAEPKEPKVEVKIVAKARSKNPAMAPRTGLLDKAGDEICVGDTVSIKAKKAEPKVKKSK